MIKRILFVVDFDGTAVNSPEKDWGIEQWIIKTGNPYPHRGWFSKPESLDWNVFGDSLVVNPQMTDWKIMLDNYNCEVIPVIITGRLKKTMTENVHDVLDKLKNWIPFQFQGVYLNSGGSTPHFKACKVEELIELYNPDMVIVVDDNRLNVDSIGIVCRQHGVKYLSWDVNPVEIW